MNPKSKMSKGKMRADNDEKVDVGKAGPSVPAAMRISGAEDLKDELLPGIPNSIVVQQIVPKMSGSVINTLCFVSASFRKTIYRRWIYDARVRSHSTDTLAVVHYSHEETYQLRLYSLNDNSAFDLPRIPSPRRIPPLIPFRMSLKSFKCIPLDGKIYVLGGVMTGVYSGHYNNEVFMLDLAGHKQWKQCASIKEGIHSFSTGVLDGKIYLIGGRSSRRLRYECEVYDPKVDSWSSIKPMISLGVGHQVAAVGGELFVYGGTGDNVNYPWHESYPTCALAYNPVENTWRQVGQSDTGDKLENPWLHAFVAQGKFHTMTPTGIHVYDIDTASWRSLHPLLQRSYDGLGTLAVGGEILTRVLTEYELQTTPSIELPSNAAPRVQLVLSRGFGNDNREIAFEEISNPRLKADLQRLSGTWYYDMPHMRRRRWKYDMCLIQL